MAAGFFVAFFVTGFLVAVFWLRVSWRFGGFLGFFLWKFGYFPMVNLAAFFGVAALKLLKQLMPLHIERVTQEQERTCAVLTEQ